MLSEQNICYLMEKAKEIRRTIIQSITNAKSGHIGGSLSSTDILVYLYHHHIRIDHKNPNWEDRDRVVLSKGHACPALYAILADKGFFDKKELQNLRKLGSILQGHPDMTKVPGIDASTGSLGQGISIANGMAIAAKLDKKDYHIFTIIGDGECQEGQIWEAAMSAAHYKLDNLTVFLDRNHLQIDGTTEQIMNIEPIVEKWKSFGWHVIGIDGHDFVEIDKAVKESNTGKPKIIVCHTIKGKGISFLENKVEFHGKPLTPEQCSKALEELK